MQSEKDGILTRKLPGAVERLGLSTFVSMDAYPIDPNRVRVLFVRNDLLGIITGKPAGDDQARVFVEQNLLLTLDPKNGIPGSLPVKVYVDRQDDPMNMSLNDNLGSGRAVYVGDCFNIKGLGKTVLATSKDPNHSNGNLDLVSSIWEMICSNVLGSNMRTGTSPVLAVVDLKKPMHVPWREQKVPGGLLIRMDEHGELDRPTHLFQRKKPVSASQMRHFARSFGMQDAEKFIERILHGCWSAGNISLDGHLIDYDTVFAVRGRAPQWSYRPNWLSDFFGLEGPGQKKLLKALVSHPINVDRVSFRELYRVFDEARQSRLEQRFPDLVGLNSGDFGAHFPAHSAIMSPKTTTGPMVQRFNNEPLNHVAALVKQFQVLSMKMYPNFKATAPWEPDNSSLSVYDLSRFFRFYPIMRRSGSVDEETALRLIRNPAGRLIETRESGIPDSVLKPLMKDYVVSSQEQVMALDKQALAFIKDYDELLTSIEKKMPGSSGAQIVRAYIVNEERMYMNCRPGNDILVALVQNSESGKIRPREFSELLQLLVDASDRIPRYDSKGRCQADLRLFLNGYTSNLLDVDGLYQPRLTFLFTETELQTAASSAWEVEIDGKMCSCSVEPEEDRTHVIGPKLSLSRLVTDDPVPLPFFCGGSVVSLKRILREDRPPPTG